MRTSLVAVLASAVLAVTANASPPVEDHELHESLLYLDTHLDVPLHFSRPGWNIMERHSYWNDLSQVDYPRMVQGGLDGGFWVVFTEQGALTPQAYASARDHALRRSLQIREMVARNSQQFELAFTADDAARIARTGRRVVYQSIENGYPVGTDLTLLKTFYDMGVRMFGVVHILNNQLADSSTDKKGGQWGGLSPLGKELVAEANRLGMVLDASHASDDTFDQMVALSRTPIVLSHTGLKAIQDYPRNIDDERLKKLAASGGVIQLAALHSFYRKLPSIPERDALLDEYVKNIERFTGPEAAAWVTKIREVEDKHGFPRADFDDLIRAIQHVVKLVGIDHVGLGIDWDGGGGLEGFQDIAALPKVTAALRKEGYSPEDIAKVAGGNVLRVLRRAESYAKTRAGTGSP